MLTPSPRWRPTWPAPSRPPPRARIANLSQTPGTPRHGADALAALAAHLAGTVAPAAASADREPQPDPRAPRHGADALAAPAAHLASAVAPAAASADREPQPAPGTPRHGADALAAPAADRVGARTSAAVTANDDFRSDPHTPWHGAGTIAPPAAHLADALTQAAVTANDARRSSPPAPWHGARAAAAARPTDAHTQAAASPDREPRHGPPTPPAADDPSRRSDTTAPAMTIGPAEAEQARRARQSAASDPTCRAASLPAPDHAGGPLTAGLQPPPAGTGPGAVPLCSPVPGRRQRLLAGTGLTPPCVPIFASPAGVFVSAVTLAAAEPPERRAEALRLTILDAVRRAIAAGQK